MRHYYYPQKLLTWQVFSPGNISSIILTTLTFPACKMTLFQRWTNVENYLYDVEPTLKKGWKRKLDWRNFSDVETTLILRCQSHQPNVNVKLTLKQRRNFKSNQRTLYRCCFYVGMLTLNQRSQNDVRITLISRCRRCQPIFNQISTSKRRLMPAGLLSYPAWLKLLKDLFRSKFRAEFFSCSGLALWYDKRKLTTTEGTVYVKKMKQWI